jgi:hypothetical protein
MMSKERNTNLAVVKVCNFYFEAGVGFADQTIALIKT